MTANISTIKPRQGFLTYPGLYTDLDLTSHFSNLPPGITFIPNLPSRKAFTAMKQIETMLGIRLKATESFFIPNLKLSEGDMIELPTNYGFYCDPDPTVKIATCVLLMASGLPPDNTRIISHPRGMVARILTRRIVNRTTLVVVPEARMNSWLDQMNHTFLAFHALRTESDLEIYSAPEEVEIIKVLMNLDVLFLSSTIYQAFSALFRNITWGRLIVEESLEHPEIINSPQFVETAEFTWYLTPDPSEWINHPQVCDRFLERGIYQDENNFPEIFSVKNNPDFLRKCLRARSVIPVSLIDTPEQAVQTSIEKMMASVSVEHFRAREILAHSYHRVCEGYRDEFTHDANDGSTTFHAMISKISLDGYHRIAQMIKQRALVDEAQKQILTHNIQVMQNTCTELFHGLSLSYHQVMQKASKTIDDRIKAALDVTRANDIRVCETYVNRMTGFVNALLESQCNSSQAFLQACSKSGSPIKFDLKKHTIPIYVVERFGQSEITTQDLQIHKQMVPSNYIPLYGQAKARTVLAVAKEARTMNLIVAVTHGIQVKAKISKRKHTLVTLMADGYELPADYNAGITVLVTSEFIHAETMLIEKDTAFFLAYKTNYLTTQGTRGILKPGIEILLA